MSKMSLIPGQVLTLVFMLDPYICQNIVVLSSLSLTPDPAKSWSQHCAVLDEFWVDARR